LHDAAHIATARWEMIPSSPRSMGL
jgi:hypothetical protein